VPRDDKQERLLLVRTSILTAHEPVVLLLVMLTQEASDYTIKEIVASGDGSSTRLAKVPNDPIPIG
jgi:hypothetical protein